ncbi:MAG: glycosyltransferase family 4 protein [candidate division KSB1 bacterium]|nr:glycosyltransferase family 4 protein [candidate division KSB1 bacterium]
MALKSIDKYTIGYHLNIGIDATGLPVTFAGAGRYMCGLIRALAQIDQRHHYFVFLKAPTQKLFDEVSTSANMTFVVLPDLSKPLRLFWQHFGAGAYARRYGLHIWHGLHYSLPNFTEGMRTVATFHDMAFFLYPQLYSPIKRIYFQKVVTRAITYADAIISVSNATADDVHRLFNGKVDAGKVRVVHSGVDEKFFSPLPTAATQQIRQRYDLHARYIFFLGTVEKRKNLPLLIRAFSRLLARGHRDVQLVLAGLPSHGLPEVKKTIVAENIAHAVRCLGYVPDSDILPLYHSAQFLVLPSVHEGFGFPLLEAMACGVPVLAADNSAIRELVAGAGLLCSGGAEAWAQKMEELLDDAALRQRLSILGRRRASEFCWQQTARATLAVYESVQPRHHPTLIFHVGPEESTDGKHNGAAKFFSATPPAGAELDAAVLKTLAYADLFEYPLQAEEVHRGLFECVASLAEVQVALQNGKHRGLFQQNGRFFFLTGRQKTVDVRAQRREYTQELWQKHAWLLRLITTFPFVRSLALSGAMVFENCKDDDDIDLLILTTPRRLWSVYLGLVLLLKLLGKRKRMCLNCLFDLDHLEIEDRDFFVAHQITFLRPLYGVEHFQNFQNTNAWVDAYFPQGRPRHANETAAKFWTPFSGKSAAGNFWLKQGLEKMLSGRFFDTVERLVFKLYASHIHRVTHHLGSDSVVALPGQIKLFTNNHRHRLIEALQSRLNQVWHDYRALAEIQEPHVVF